MQAPSVCHPDPRGALLRGQRRRDLLFRSRIQVHIGSARPQNAPEADAQESEFTSSEGTGRILERSGALKHQSDLHVRILRIFGRTAMINYRGVFEAVVTDPRYIANLDWGEARQGHPEGTVRAHIAEIEPNLEVLRPKLTEEDYWRLKLLIHTHDTFKGEAELAVPITDPKSHSSLARTFLERHCSDPDLLAMVQYHDEPFALFRQFETKGKYNEGRFDALLNAIQDWNLFLAFNIIDGCTPGKSREPLHWFFRELDGRVQSKFSVGDVIDS